MTPSAKCEALIKSFEGCRLTAYMPTPNDVPTIGWGSTGKDIHLGDTWSQDKADARFHSDLKRFGIGVQACLADSPTTQNEYDACVSLAYNIGLRNFSQSTVLRKHKSDDKDGAADAFRLWVKQDGKTLSGLVRRRLAESQLYLGI